MSNKLKEINNNFQENNRQEVVGKKQPPNNKIIEPSLRNKPPWPHSFV